MKWIRIAFKITAIVTLSIFTSATFAMLNNIRQTLSTYTLDCSHWYVGANLGFSHLHDQQTPNLSSSVDENGPGFSVATGYQWNSLFGAELGYTQYYNSRENAGILNIAKTTHYAVNLAATGRYPLVDHFSVLGKLGVAYSYANKVYTATGISGASGAVSPYAGLGIAYSLTPKVDMIAQWAGVRGNNYTGSSELYSLGFNFAIA